jgi:hypothetical protein
MILRYMIAALMIVASSAAASASGTAQEQAACRPDVRKHCAKEADAPEVVAGTREQVVLMCLKQNRAKLSEGCVKVLESHGQ